MNPKLSHLKNLKTNKLSMPLSLKKKKIPFFHSKTSQTPHTILSPFSLPASAHLFLHLMQLAEVGIPQGLSRQDPLVGIVPPLRRVSGARSFWGLLLKGNGRELKEHVFLCCFFWGLVVIIVAFVCFNVWSSYCFWCIAQVEIYGNNLNSNNEP